MWASIDANGVVTLTARTRWRKDFVGDVGIAPSRFGDSSFTGTGCPNLNVTVPTSLRITQVSSGIAVYTFPLNAFNLTTSITARDNTPAQFNEVTQVLKIPLGTTSAGGQVNPPRGLPHGLYEISWNDWSRITGIQNINTTDPCGGQDSGFGARVRVNFDGAPHTGPSLTSTFITAVPRGFTYAQNLNASSPLALTYRLETGPSEFPTFGSRPIAGLTLDAATGLLTIPDTSTPALLDNALAPTSGADYVIHVEITDSAGGVSVRDGVLDAITSTNHPPAIDHVGNLVAHAGEPIDFAVHATDVDSGQTLNLAATGLPVGATFAPATGPASGVTSPFTWTPTHDQIGTVCMNFEATDSGTAAASFVDAYTTQEHVCIDVRPSAVCHDQTVEASPNTCGSVASCDCDGGTLDTQPAFTGAGVFTFSCTCSSEVGSDTCSGTLVVVDATKPSISCPANVTSECTSNATANVFAGAATAGDTCGPVTVSEPTTSTFPLGTTTVAHTATDGSGNTAACSNTVTVVDTTKPSIACPAPVTAECTGGAAAPVMPGIATASDSCTAVALTGPLAGSYPLGTTTVAYTAQDGSGNAASCTSQIAVVDTTKPTITCPIPVVAECTGNKASPVYPLAATASDVCTPVDLTGPDAGSYPLGTTTVAYGAADQSGNTSACTSQITVVDTTPPAIACPAPIVAECTGGNSATVVPGVAQSADGCSDVSINGPATASYPLGNTTVSYVATDESANTSACSALISVVDTTKPAITVPANATTQYVLGSCSGAPLALPIVPTASDSCQGALPVACTSVPGASYGANTVTCTATDASGNTSSATVTLVVMQPLEVIFDPPLTGGEDVVNRFTVNQTLVHKVRLFDCGHADVTATAPVTVTLDVQLRQTTGTGSVEIMDVPTEYNGVGDAGSRLVLVGGDYQYNLDTKGYQKGTQNTANFYQSTVSVVYPSAPGVIAGHEVANLESK